MKSSPCSRWSSGGGNGSYGIVIRQRITIIMHFTLIITVFTILANQGYLHSTVIRTASSSLSISANADSFFPEKQHNAHLNKKKLGHQLVHPSNELDGSPTRLRQENIAHLKGSCSQLFESHQYYIDHVIPPLRVSMVQLVGIWNDPILSQTMQDVYQSNAQLLWENHRINSTGITETPACIIEDKKRQSSDTISNCRETADGGPAYWKPSIIWHMCQDRELRPDLVYYLDADIVLVNPTVRIDALWFYMKRERSKHNQSLEILFDSDFNGLNSGSFVVNCSSVFAMDLLRLWDRVALDLSHRGLGIPDWMEQSSLHVMLESRAWKFWEWRKERHIWDTDELMLKKYQEDDALRDNTAVLPTEELKQRIGLAASCSLSSLYQPNEKRKTRALAVNGLFKSGHSYAAHCAGDHDVEDLQRKLRSAVAERRNWTTMENYTNI